MTLTLAYTSTKQIQIIISLGTEMKRAILKWNKSNNEHTECDLRFNDTYHLYKYNIGGINCHHIRVKDQKNHMKME